MHRVGRTGAWAFCTVGTTRMMRVNGQDSPGSVSDLFLSLPGAAVKPSGAKVLQLT
jgi:hypothetical protein